MAKDTGVDAMAEGLDQLAEGHEQLLHILTKHGVMLTHLEQREIPDIGGLTRRLEDVADAVDRLAHASPSPGVSWRRQIGVLLLTIVCGYMVCWATVRWLPSGALPPGFSRGEPVKQKGKF